MLHEIVVFTTNVKEVEDEIQALYQIITFALPLIGAAVIASLAVIYRVMGVAKKNAENTHALVKLANGQYDRTQESLQRIEHGQTNAAGLAQSDREFAQRTADGRGTEDTALPLADAPERLQPPG